MDYGEVLRKTWDISWRNKGLWLLGILAGCSASGRGNFGTSTSGARSYSFDSADFGRYDKATPFGDLGPIQEEVLIPIFLGLLCLILIAQLLVLILGDERVRVGAV